MSDCFIKLIGILLGVAMGASAALAQPSKGRVIHGRVVDVRDGSGLPSVEVLERRTGRSVRTDSTGVFRMVLDATDRLILLVRAPGYRPVEDTLTLATYGGESRLISLDRAPQSLSEVEITERGGVDITGLRDFERRSVGSGRFLRRADIEAVGARSLESIIRSRIPGFAFVRLPNGGVALAGRRSNELSLVKRPPREEGLADRCYSQVFVNGQRLYAYSAPPSMPPRLDDFDPVEIVALEFYRGPAETPTEFSGPSAACGTVAIWTQLPTQSK